MENETNKFLITLGIFVFILATIITLQKPLITSNTITGEVVETSKEEFNLRVEIPSEYKTINEGEKIWFTVKILNLANQERVDVQLVYEIKEESGKIITSRKETVAIETQASFVGSIEIPKETKKGAYILDVQMISANGDISYGHTTFKISEKKDILFYIQEYYLFIIIGISLIFIISILIKLKPQIIALNEKRKIKSKIKRIIRSKVKSKKVTEEELKTSKLPKQKPIIDDSKEKKYY